MLPGELEALLESRTLELQRATSNFHPGSSPFDELRSRSHNDPNYFTRDSGQRAPLGCVPYKIDTDLAACEQAPSREHATFGDDSASQNYRPDASGLDHLAHAAMSSPLIVASHAKQTTPDIDPSLSRATSVSFPTFPHDIFNSGAETYATPALPPSTEIPVNQSVRANIRQSGSVGLIDGLPSKELLNIMFVLLWLG
jgi:hypothetical protein